MSIDDRESPAEKARVTRREFVKIGISGSLAAGIAPAFAAPAAQEKPREYPVATVAQLDALKVDSPVAFTYPDENSPAVLIRLRGAAMGGIGPGDTIVAFSILCTHKGCPVSYRPERKMMICPCHWSSFDPAKTGQMVIGQGSQALPQVKLRLQGSAIQAIGIEGLIYGRHTNIL
jgi:arsenite oxidase small subunit